MRQGIFIRAGWIGGLLFAILLAGVGGCGRTATVAGKVSYQGRAVTHGTVIFHSEDKTVHRGAIASDGSYAVEGVPAGTAKIVVISHNPAKRGSAGPGQQPVRANKKGAAAYETTAKGWFPLPFKFEDPHGSGLSCTVGSGRLSHDIELK